MNFPLRLNKSLLTSCDLVCMKIHLQTFQDIVKKVAKKVQVATSFLDPNSSSAYQKSSKKWNKLLQKLKFECSFKVEKWIMQETEKNELNLVGFIHIFLICIFSDLENHFPFECSPNIKARNFHQHFTSMTEAKQHTFTGWDQSCYNFKEISLLQLNMLMQNCNERRNNLHILLRDTSKMWAGWCLGSELDVPKEFGALFGILIVCHGSFTTDLKMILHSYSSANLESFGLWFLYKRKHTESD